MQDPGTRGYRGWKTAACSHSARTAHGAPPPERVPNRCDRYASMQKRVPLHLVLLYGPPPVVGPMFEEWPRNGAPPLRTAVFRPGASAERQPPDDVINPMSFLILTPLPPPRCLFVRGGGVKTW